MTRLFFVPDGTGRQRKARRQFERGVLDVAGGLTSTDGTGQWRDGTGRLYRERVREVLVMAGPAAMRKVCRMFGEYGRKAGEKALLSLRLR